MKVKTIKYSIYPFHGRILAEIFYIHDDLQIHLDDKSFGSWFRDTNDQDYKDAREWAENHLKNIYHANKQTP